MTVMSNNVITNVANTGDNNNSNKCHPPFITPSDLYQAEVEAV